MQAVKLNSENLNCGQRIITRKCKKADSMRSLEGSRPRSEMVSSLVTIGILDQSMYQNGYTGTSGDSTVS